MIYIIEFENGLDLSKTGLLNPTSSRGVGYEVATLIFRYPNNLRLMESRTEAYDISPENFGFRRNDYQLTVNTDGTGIIRLLPRYSDVSHEFVDENGTQIMTGSREFKIPQDTAIIPLIGPNNKRELVLWSIVLYQREQLPLA